MDHHTAFEEHLSCTDPAPCLDWLLSLSESERRALAPRALQRRRELSRLADESWQLGVEARAEVRTAPFYLPTAHHAVLATATLSEMRAGPPLAVEEAEALRIFEVRRPDWLQAFAEWTPSWPLVRQLMRRGWIARPPLENYVPAMIGLLTNLSRRSAQYGHRSIRESLLQEGLLAEEVWCLFEAEGGGEFSLAAADKYLQGENWSESLSGLARDGHLPRQRLLDATLEALSRDFAQFRAGWFSRFHDELAPTAAEQDARRPAYLRLLGSSIPPTVSLALRCVQKLDQRKPFSGAELLPALTPVLSAKGKAAVQAGLGLLDRLSAREPTARPEVLALAASALLHEAREIQVTVLALLERHGQPAEVRAALEPFREAVVPSLRDRLASWFVGAEPPPPPEEPSPPGAQLGRLVAIDPVSDPADLPHLAGQILEGAADAEQLERLLDGLSRFADWRPADFAARTGALAQRARACVTALDGLGNHLALLILAWLERSPTLATKPVRRAAASVNLQFQFVRLQALAAHLAGGRPLPLLSAPTHRGGWIQPEILVVRWQEWERAGLRPHLHERILAMLRLHPHGREAALRLAARIAGEDGQALRHALGGDEACGSEVALWLTAARARQPVGDLPVLSGAFPELASKVGREVRFRWAASLSQQESGGQKWTSFELALHVTPPPWRDRPIAFLTVDAGDRWNSSGTLLSTDWQGTWWPGNLDGHFASSIPGLASAIGYGDVSDRDQLATFLPLVRPGFELGEMALLALALGLAAKTAVLRQAAEDAAIAVIAAGRIDGAALGAVCRRLLASGAPVLARWAQSWATVAAHTAGHARFIRELLESALQPPAQPEPRMLGPLLDLGVELTSAARTPFTAPATRAFLSTIRNGKAGKTARLLLEARGKG